jgi:hypothetical protein
MIEFSVCLAITVLSALVSLGFSIAAVMKSAGQTRTTACYAAARSLSFALLSLVPALTGSHVWLQAVAVGMIIVQACDAAIGVSIRDRMKTYGPAGTALATLIALVWFSI